MAGAVPAGWSREHEVPPPLPLSAVDEMIMHLQDARSPWNVQVELAVDGRVDEATLHLAVGACTRRHPMARARLAPWRRSDRTYSWAFAEEADVCPVRLARCPDEAALEELRRRLHGERIELGTSPGLRVVLARCAARDVVLLSANHVVADGVGALRLMTSIARAYRGVDDPLDPSPLHEARDLDALLAPDDRGERRARRREAARQVREALDPPARLVGRGPGGPPGVGFVCRVVELDDAPALADRAPDTSVNDVLLAALHLTIAGWNTAAGARADRVGVMMPVNLRPPERFWEVVANFASMVSISTHPADRVDLRTATLAVAAQTREIRREVRARGLFDLLEVAAGSPVGVKRATSRLVPFVGGERLIDTAVLSNLGRLAEPPTLDGEPPGELWFSPPCDRVCSVGIGVVTVGKSLMLSVRYRREVFDPAAAEAFTDQFVARLAVPSDGHRR
jgi:NRPS condensation-like uncharacterized protein